MNIIVGLPEMTDDKIIDPLNSVVRASGKTSWVEMMQTLIAYSYLSKSNRR